MKKINNLLFTIIIIFFLAFLIFSYRSIFFTPYDNNYYRDLYDHSQWNIAISKRSVSDDIVYKVTGFDLVKNWSFFQIDPQTPVLGKYLYGYSILLFHNAEIISIFVFLFSAFFFYLISKKILSDGFLAQASLLIFVSEPLIFQQMSLSMLDLPQLLFLLVHIYSILELVAFKKKSKYIFWLLVSGLTLGGFISLKIGFFSIAIIIADLLYLYLNKKIFRAIPIILIAGLTYIVSYLPFFLQGHTLIEFLKNQKWIVISYWMASKSKPIYGMAVITLISGFIKGWYKGATLDRVAEWTILWPAYLLISFKLLLGGLSKLDRKVLYLLIMSGCFIFLYSIVPFSARYLVLVIPLLILISIKNIFKIRKLFLIIIISLYFFQIINVLRPSPTSVLSSIARVWKVGAYQDLYSFLDKSTKNEISRRDFWRHGQLLEKNLGVTEKNISIHLPYVFFWQNETKGNLEINYITKLGKIVNNQKVHFVREENNWRIKWNYQLLLNKYNLGDKIVTNYENGRYGKLLSKKGQIISEAVIRPIFFVTHANIKDEFFVQNQLIFLIGLKKHDLEYIYKANWQPDWPAEIGPLKYNLSPEVLDNYKFDESISIEYRPMRIKNLEYLALYPQLDPVLGGSIILEKKDGSKQTIIKRDKVDGQDIIYEKDNSIR